MTQRNPFTDLNFCKQSFYNPETARQNKSVGEKN